MFADSRMTKPIKTTNRPWAPWFAARFALLCILLSGPLRADEQILRADEQTLRELNQCLQNQDLTNAAILGEKLFEDTESSFDITLPLARLARDLQRGGDKIGAIRFYQYAVAASNRPQAESLQNHTRVMLGIATALLLTEEKAYSEACDQLSSVTGKIASPSEPPQEKTIETAASLLNRIGSATIESKDFDTAVRAFTLACELPSAEKNTSKLGRAWAIALGGNHPQVAALELEQFVAEYPEHQDSPKAALLAIECRQKSDDSEGALRDIAMLLQNWPQSSSARKLVHEFTETPCEQIPVAVKTWILNQGESDAVSQLDTRLAAIGLVAAAEQRVTEPWNSLANVLATLDQDGLSSTLALNELTRLGHKAEAERLAARFIAPAPSSDAKGSSPAEPQTQPVTAAAREAGCRWAGREAKWSMLALASESESVLDPSSSRNSSVERLLAEALVQMGRISEAAAWWNYLVDVRGENDFSTLIRCAEAETSSGNDSEKALERIAAAKAAAGDQAFALALVELLEAELLIRKTAFDESRSRLEPIVENENLDRNLRGRAQWLIGETYYLQEKYAQAIQAYRKVESIEPEKTWVAASLIQAGKSFEHLGYRREAIICYSNLVSRFADSSYADAANKRIAAIDIQKTTTESAPQNSMKR